MTNSLSEITHERAVELVEQFGKLFSGRSDAYGAWAGACIKATVTYDTFQRHLSGSEQIGIYPLMSDNTVRWGCSDIDYDNIDDARNLQMALQVKGIPAFVEKTTRGFHIWVFVDEPVPAAIMRRAFLSAYEAIGLPAKEVNPKQEESTGLGNYVRLPYPGVFVSKVLTMFERTMLDDMDNPMPFDLFIAEATENLATVDLLRPLAELHKPRVISGNYSLVASPHVDEALGRAPGLVAVVWRRGPLEGHDRSSTLFYLANEMKRGNVEVNDAYTILVDADKRWGKYFLRANGEELLKKIIDDVYGGVA